MATIDSMLCIANEEIPAAWAAPASFALTRTAVPYLLIAADRKDGMIDLILYHKTKTGAELLGQRKLPLSVDRLIAEKMTGALFQQIQLRRKMGNGTVQGVVQDFESIFQRTEAEMQMFKKLMGLLASQNGISIGAVNETIRGIVSGCTFNFSKYAPFFKKQPAQNTMLHLFNGAFMEWNGVMRMLREFMYEHQQWVEDPHGDMQIVLCGSLLKLACLSEPSFGSVSNVQFSPSSSQLLYRMSYEMFKSPARGQWKLFMVLNNYPYEKAMLETYAKNAAPKQQRRPDAKAKIRVFSEQMLALPLDAGIYAAKIGGKKLPLNGRLMHRDEQKNRLLAAPFTEQFSALIAEGTVEIRSLTWTQEQDGWTIAVKYACGGREYNLRPQIYRESQITMLENFPGLVMYKLPGKPEMYLSNASSAVRAELYGGVKNDGLIRMDSSETTYLRLYRDRTTFLGQIDYRMKRGGGQNG